MESGWQQLHLHPAAVHEQAYCPILTPHYFHPVCLRISVMIRRRMYLSLYPCVSVSVCFCVSLPFWTSRQKAISSL
jgi:hypothetical protein